MPEQPVLQIATRPAQPKSPIARTEDDQIEEIVVRLGRRYTRDQISIAELTTRVRISYNGFAAARIRSFVSIFVERLVRRSVESPLSKT